MATGLEYMKKKDADSRSDAQYLNTSAGQSFVKRRILPLFNDSIDAATDFERGVQEGQRRLAREILEISNIGKNDE